MSQLVWVSLVLVTLAAVCVAVYLAGRTRALRQESQDSKERQIALETEAAALRSKAERSEAEIGSLRTEIRALATREARLTAELEAERKAAQEKLALLEDARATLADAFKALSADALKSSSESFLKLAQESLARFQQGAKAELEARQKAIEQITQPIRERLEKFDGKLDELEKNRVGAYRALSQQVQDLVQTHLPQLHRETSALVQALRQPQARGRWGEEQLKRVVELAGMLEHCDFEQQVSVNVDERRQRPDLVVRLPGGRNIVIDAKVAIDAYLSAVEAPDEASRERLLDQHAAQVRAHVQRLAAKSYFEQFDPTPEFVVLFVPGEAFFSAALMRDPTLIGFAAENRVIPASPTTLIALLKAVAYGWRQEALAQNARDIAALGKDLYERIGRLAEHWSDVGERIRQATEAYNRSVGTLEARDLPAARRFRDLRAVGDANKIKDLIPLTTETRALSAEELTRRPGGLIWGGRRRSAVAEVVASAAGYILIRWRKQFSRGQGCRFARHLKSGAADAELIRLCLSGTDRQSSVSLATETVR